jgi:hypothetical protein
MAKATAPIERLQQQLWHAMVHHARQHVGPEPWVIMAAIVTQLRANARHPSTPAIGATCAALLGALERDPVAALQSLGGNPLPSGDEEVLPIGNTSKSLSHARAALASLGGSAVRGGLAVPTGWREPVRAPRGRLG